MYESDLLSIHDFIFDKIIPKFTSYDKPDILSKYFDSYYDTKSYYEHLIDFFQDSDVEGKIDWTIRDDYKKKINLCYYNIGMCYYNEKEYSDAIYSFNNCIDNKFCTYEYKKKSREKISMCNYYKGKEEYDYGNFSTALGYLETSKEYFSDCSNSWKDSIKSLLSKTYKKIGEQTWNKNYESSMKSAIEYYQKAYNNSSGSESSNISNIINNLNEYYYLYKAYNSSNKDRENYLYSSYSFKGSYSSSIYDLYQKQGNFSNIRNDINNINSRISNLRDENYYLRIDLSNQNKLNETKRGKIQDINDKITKIQKDMEDKSKKLNDKVDDIIKESEDKIEEQKETNKKTEQNIKEQENFLEDLKKMEEQKEIDIKNKKEINNNLKQQNQQYLVILKNFEEKLKKRLE